MRVLGESIVLAAILCGLSVPGTLFPQWPSSSSTLEIRGGPTCAQCRFSVSPVVVLGREGTGPSTVVQGVWAVDSRRNYFVNGPTPYQVAMFDSLGRAVRTIGRAGQGPGELGRVGTIHIGRGDSLWVLDRTARKLNVFAPGGGSFARSASLGRPVTNWILLTESDDVVYSLALPFGIAKQGPTVHVIARGTANPKAIGPPPRTAAPTPQEPVTRIFGRANARGRFWTAETLGNEIELWDIEGRVHRRVRLMGDALPVVSGGTASKGRDGATRPRIHEIREDPRGRLWVWFVRPNARYVAPAGHFRIGDLEQQTVKNPYEMVLEVLDLETHRVVASMVTVMPLSFLGADLFLETTGTPEEITLTVQRVVLVEPGAK